MKLLNNIKQIRWDLNLNLRDLEKLSGVSNSTISKIENGLMIPTQLTMLKISRALNKETNEVFELNWKK
jgi:transcriptional regulator with XRE-family HTH domain